MYLVRDIPPLVGYHLSAVVGRLLRALLFAVVLHQIGQNSESLFHPFLSGILLF